ncbi:hypothetical protein P8H27_18680 [Pseudomonas sp. sp1636]|uniref:hypothetical protein n=1 Tax=Pseudomonas sp. sp1636 TaxID=3036707 RepID=UPI0025A52582|nr:hypothetical protein [Pseudomonas sp. sp1636]MDM8350905.1 hypothetical protein [Pseudomonas sp. sp1636]
MALVTASARKPFLKIICDIALLLHMVGVSTATFVIGCGKGHEQMACHGFLQDNRLAEKEFSAKNPEVLERYFLNQANSRPFPG